jgi:hypothetical protein
VLAAGAKQQTQRDEQLATPWNDGISADVVHFFLPGVEGQLL